MKHFKGCMVCGEELIYFEDYQDIECNICKGSFKTNVTCKDKHYVCDSCHRKDGFKTIEEYCVNIDERDPLKILTRLMKDPRISLHGPEHHFLVPAVLLTSYYNQIDPSEKRKKLRLAQARAKDIQGGMCGYFGACGAAIGAGIFASLITGATPLSEDSWGYANRQTGYILTEIGKVGGPRCCKRNSFLTVIKAAEFLHLDKGVLLFDYKNARPVCDFKSQNKECIGTRCPFFLNK